MRIALIGYGKMGHMIESIALERGHSVVCAIDANNDLKIENLRLKIYSPEEGFESEEFRSADVAIEFSTPATAKDNILRAWAQGVPVVSGTTGWRPEGLQVTGYRLRELDGKKYIYKDDQTMLVWSSNYSVGVNIFFDLNQFLAKEMDNEKLKMENGKCLYTPSITEIHHIHKLDKPSGTAKTLAEGLRVMGYGLQDSEIESIREGEVPGTHEVKWDSEEDTIIITHIAKGRRGFALGAVLAAEELKIKN